ncbi:MAG TPA: cupin domain-containing protein [Usitatibacter sp.]|nr:cupin domain-containing protein [Usitatibacter sp.]
MASTGTKATAHPRYDIKASRIVMESADMRVIDQTLAAGECVPWHLHPETDDYVICLRGELEVREVNPDRTTTLRALERYLVPRKTPHTTVNASSEDCQFLIVQGPGKVEFVPLPKLDVRSARE